MKKERLFEMANDIGDFFKSESDREAAVKGVLNHISRFWDPRMKRQIIAFLDEDNGDLNPIVHEAIVRLKSSMENAA